MSTPPVVLLAAQGQAVAGEGRPALPPELAFLAAKGVPPRLLDEAAALARDCDIPPVDALLRGGFLAERIYYRLLAAELGLPFVTRLDAADGARFPESVRIGVVPLKAGDAPHAFAIAPGASQVAGLLAGRRLGAAGVVMATPTSLRSAVMRACAHAIASEAADALATATPAFSSRTGLWPRQIVAIAAAAFVVAAAIAWAPVASLLVLGALGNAAFVGIIVLRLDAVRTPIPVAPTRPPPRWPDRMLPVYTVIVAMRRESRVIQRLLHALGSLDYPSAKLDLKIVIEADDAEMRAALAGRVLPPNLEIVVAPPGEPRTKPRALNVALPLARGELAVVYDAEDVPAPDQLRLAVTGFARGGPDLGCLQGRLVTDNTNDSWLTRLFTIEYAALFDVINPGLAALGLPVPLGGTSTHFRGIR